MRIRLSVIVLLGTVALLLAGGCERGDSQAISSEADEANFRHGQQLVKQGRSQEALAAFLKVIAKRGESAPESHLEAGLLYLDQVKDPLAAIYHFRKYLELLPNSRQAVYVRGRIDVAKREFARTLPAQPLESQSGVDLLEKIDRLQRENEQLTAELAVMREGSPSPMTRSRATLENAAMTEGRSAEQRSSAFLNPQLAVGAPAADSPVSLASEPPAVEPAAPTWIEPAPTPAPRSAPTKPTPPAAGGRRHTVVKGDTLFSLAQRYYGNRAKWRDIYAANRDVLPSENSLRLGMELTIP
jgi:tetratricopeptide (TPR) repeat protein